VTDNKDPLAGLKAATEHLSKDTPEEEAMGIIKSALVFLLDLSPLDLERAIGYLKGRCALDNSYFSALKKEIKQAKAKTKRQKAQLGDLEEVRRLHPAIDFHEDFISVGFRVDLPDNDTGLLLLISDGEGVRDEVNPDTVEIAGRVYQIIRNTAPPILQDVWNLERLKAFLEHPTRPLELYQTLKETFKKYIDLPEPAYGLLATWAVGTYFAHQFTAFPFLHFHGPKECGKSKTLEAKRCVCLNAWKGRDISAAALGDTAEAQRGTLLLDQAEKLSSDKENGNLIGLLADSYKKAGGKRRVIDTKNPAGRTVLEFSTYGPKAFASTKNIDPDLADRCIKIPMTRTRRRLPDLEGWEPIWGELRDQLYRFTLMAFKEVRVNYEANSGNGTRIGELWRPLLAVLMTLGVEEPEVEVVRGLFMAAVEETRHELDPWESILFEVLRERAESETGNFEMMAEEVLKAMDIEGDRQPGGKWVGNALSRFSLFSKRLPRKYADDTRKRKVQPYLFSPGHVLKMYEIYMRDTPQYEASQASQAENTNDTDLFHGTEGNSGTCPKPSHEADRKGLGRNGTCPEKVKCPTEHNGIIADSDLGRMGREDLGGMGKKNIHTFSDEEEELLAGRVP
jgi:hypothetical protein